MRKLWFIIFTFKMTIIAVKLTSVCCEVQSTNTFSLQCTYLRILTCLMKQITFLFSLLCFCSWFISSGIFCYYYLGVLFLFYFGVIVLSSILIEKCCWIFLRESTWSNTIVFTLKLLELLCALCHELSATVSSIKVWITVHLCNKCVVVIIRSTFFLNVCFVLILC